jgi:hypothetical protein
VIVRKPPENRWSVRTANAAGRTDSATENRAALFIYRIPARTIQEGRRNALGNSDPPGERLCGQYLARPLEHFSVNGFGTTAPGRLMSPQPARRRWIVSLGLATVMLAGRASAGDGVPPKGSELVRAPAELLLERGTDLLKRANSISVEIQGRRDTKTRRSRSRWKIDIARPNRIAIWSLNEGAEKIVVCDGQKLYVSALSAREYTEHDAPASLEELSCVRDLEAVGLRSNQLLEMLCAGDPYKALMRHSPFVSRAGIERLDGRSVNRL